MEIDWSKAPEGTTCAVAGASGDIGWCREVGNSLYKWNGDGWELLNGFTANQWKELYRFKELYKFIEKPSLTIQQLRSLVQESGLQIEFHANGDIYVWDDTYEEGTRVSSLEEYVRLAEAKAAYVKLWADYIWE